MRSANIKIAWLAGIIDGEGNLGIEKHNVVRLGKKGQRYCIYAARIIVTNTDDSIIKEVLSIYKKVGITFYCRKRKRLYSSDGYKRKPCWDLQVHRLKEVLLLSNLIRPFLISKRKVKIVNLLIDFCQHRLKERSRVSRNGLAGYSDYEKRIYEKIILLNKKGI